MQVIIFHLQRKFACEMNQEDAEKVVVEQKIIAAEKEEAQIQC